MTEKLLFGFEEALVRDDSVIPTMLEHADSFGWVLYRFSV